MARIETVNGERLMTAAEVGGLYRVGIWAVDRWAADGKLHSLTGPDGELRFYAGQVMPCCEVRRGSFPGAATRRRPGEAVCLRPRQGGPPALPRGDLLRDLP